MSDTGPMWLTRDDDVVSHLYFAAAEVGKAIMEVGAVHVPGSLSFPNPEEKTFSFFTHGEVDLNVSNVKEGDVVCFRYEQGESTYSFLSEIDEISEQQTRCRWRVRFPQAIERNQRRLVRRHRVFGRPGFYLNSEISGGLRDRYELYDVAAAGLSFVMSTAKLPAVGGAISISIHLPGCEPIAMRVEIRNIRPLPGDADRKLVGCRFTEVHPSDREALCRVLGSLG